MNGEVLLKDPILLTPGPLTTSAQTKSAMLSDFGSWDGAFNAVTASVCRDLLAIVEGQADHVCVPLQGSGTFAVEAALGTLVPRGGKVLVPDNGAYCKRIVRILGYLGREAVVLAHGEQEPADVARIDAALAADPGDHPRRASALRNRHGDPESLAGDRRRQWRATAAV